MQGHKPPLEARAAAGRARAHLARPDALVTSVVDLNDPGVDGALTVGKALAEVQASVLDPLGERKALPVGDEARSNRIAVGAGADLDERIQETAVYAGAQDLELCGKGARRLEVRAAGSRRGALASGTGASGNPPRAD